MLAFISCYLQMGKAFRKRGHFKKGFSDVLYIESFNETLKPICTVKRNFSTETRILILSFYRVSTFCRMV